MSIPSLIGRCAETATCEATGRLSVQGGTASVCLAIRIVATGLSKRVAEASDRGRVQRTIHCTTCRDGISGRLQLRSPLSKNILVDARTYDRKQARNSRRGLFVPFVPLRQFAPQNANILRCFDADTDRVSLKLDDGDLDVVADENCPCCIGF